MIPPGEWHTYRHDDRLTAHCDLPGDITRPHIAWKTHIGGTRQQIVPLRGVACEIPEILLCYGGVIIRADVFGNQKWRSAPLGIQAIAAVLDIDADGREEIVTCSGMDVMLLSADNGEVLWRYRVAPPESNGTFASALRVHNFFPPGRDLQLLVPAYHTKDVFMFEFSRGVRHGALMHALHMEDAFHPTVLIGDVDADGNDEICVCRLGDLAVFDAHSGKMQALAEWNTDGERRRTYGLIELNDVDNDGALECVLISNQVTRHIAVLDNDGKGNFTPLWDRFIEHIYPDDTTDVRYSHNSVIDCDGDGNQEIIASIFNEKNDARWRTEIIDPTTGETKASFDDRYFWDACDIDGDGMPELLLSREDARLPNQHSALEIVHRMDDRAPIWSKSDASFVMNEGMLKPSQGIYHTALFARNALVTDRESFYIYDGAERTIKISRKDYRETPIYTPPSADHRRYVACITPPFVTFTDAKGLVCTIEEKAEGAPLRAEFPCGASLATDGHPVERPSPTPVVFTAHGGRYLAIPDYGNHVSLFHHDAAGAPVFVWRKHGRGRIGFDYTHHSVSLADINNDGEPEILFAEPGDYGVLAAYAVSGERINCFPFPGFPSITLGARTGCYDWLVLKDESIVRLFVSWYASLSMNSEASLSLDARSGTEHWKRETIGEGESGRGFGAWGLASSNGAHEIFFCAKDLLCRVDGMTGAIIGEPVLLTALTRDEMFRQGIYKGEDMSTWVTRDDPFSAYGSVLLHDVNADGRDEIFVLGNFGGFGALDKDLNMLWWHVAMGSDVLYRIGGIAAIHGNGKCSLGIGHSDGTFVSYDALSGKEEWRLALGNTTVDCAVCDIDGDGRDEFVCRTTDGRLLAVGVDVNGAPIIKWQMSFDYSVGNPVIADLDGDGKPEIFVANGDGWLYCIEEKMKDIG